MVSGEFSNKLAVVTGGSRGIGREIAADFARGRRTDGHCVFVG